MYQENCLVHINEHVKSAAVGFYRSGASIVIIMLICNLSFEQVDFIIKNVETIETNS